MTRTIVALLSPFIAFAVQTMLWENIRPYVWFLFYPAVFFSSWIGGLRNGLIATSIATALVWWFFVPPEHAFVKDLGLLFPACVFFAMGGLFAVFHDRVRKTNERLRRISEERQVFACLVDNSSDFIGIADPEGKPVYVNPAGRRMVGLAADHPIATTQIPEYYPADQRTFASEVIVKAMVEQGHWSGETFFRNWETQEPIPVSDTHFMIREPDTGQILGMGTITRDSSERKRLEQSLREASADLTRAQSVAEVGSWRLDVPSGGLWWSDETYRLFGIPAGTPMTYETFLARVHPDDRAYVDKQWRAALRGEPYDIEHRVAVNGNIRWLREKAELEFDEHGALIGGIGIVQNLTERKRLEEELRLAELRSSGIVSISADAIISIDERQRITMFNEGAERMFGYSKAEAIGAPLDILIPERLREIHRQHVERFSAGQVVARRMGERAAAIAGLRRNGQEFPADASISKLEVGGKRVLTVSVRDVTQEKRIDAEHRFLADVGSVLSSTLEYEETLTNIAELAVRDLSDFCIIDMMGEAGEFRRFKVTCRDRANTSICDALARISIDPSRPYLTGSVMKTMRTAVLPHVSPEMITSMAQSDQHLAALQAMDARSVIVAPLVAHGALLGAIALVASGSSRPYGDDDVTLVEELALRAAFSIENARLYAKARRAVQSRDDVLGIVAHDLRSPLNSIALQAELLRLEGNEQARRATDTIKRAATRMNRLIQDLLDVARMESGRLSVDHALVSTVAVLSDAVEAQRSLAASNSIDLQLDVSHELPDIWADRDRLLQIFENLIGNALKFTQHGGRIAVGAAPRDDEILFWVSDTGSGIALDDQPHVFDRFWQSRDARRHGAGLGLPIVKGLVEAHGGRIWFDSTPGRGSTFFFTLPAGRPLDTRHEPVEAHHP